MVMNLVDVLPFIRSHAQSYVANNPDKIANIDILQEECAELIQALSKYKRGGENNRKLELGVIEEITHVLISIHAVSNFFEDVTVLDTDDEVHRKDILLHKEEQ